MAYYFSTPKLITFMYKHTIKKLTSKIAERIYNKLKALADTIYTKEFN